MHLKLMIGETPNSGQKMSDNYSSALASVLAVGLGKAVGLENLVGLGKAVGLESHVGQGKAAGHASS